MCGEVVSKRNKNMSHILTEHKVPLYFLILYKDILCPLSRGGGVGWVGWGGVFGNYVVPSRFILNITEISRDVRKRFIMCRQVDMIG